MPRRRRGRNGRSGRGQDGLGVVCGHPDGVGDQLGLGIQPDHVRPGLVRQYAGLRLGGTDASVVAICERLGIVTVATVNLRDFAAVRPRHIPVFITVPGPS